MNVADHSQAQDSRLALSFDASAVIAALRLRGAARFDPVRLHYLQVLADRTNAHQGPVKALLDAKLAQALTAFGERFEQAQSAARDKLDRSVPQHLPLAAELQGLLQAGDLRGVRQGLASLVQRAPQASLGELTRSMVQQAQLAPQPVETGFDAPAGLRPELKTTRYFRNTWSKLSVDKRVAQALAQAPKNAGPINSHMLVLRSLALMRDISPDYLNRFTSYVDTLLCLDQYDEEKQATARKVAEADSSKKTKVRRARPR
jgi:hypothetical protein